MARGFRFVGALLACGLGLAGCSAGFGSEAEGVSVEGAPAVATVESSVESPSASSPDGVAVSSEFKRPRDSNGKPIWTDGVVGRGYVIPPQPKGAPPLPQWVKDFDPEMPEAARQPTEAGAKAFAEYAFASTFFEFNTGTTSITRSISKRKNANYSKELDALDKQVRDGAWARMSKFEIVSSNVVEANADKTGYLVDVSYKASLVYVEGDGVEAPTEKIYSGRASIFYDAEGKWFVYELAFPRNSA